MDRRNQKRFWILVNAHTDVVQAVAAGVKALPGVGTSFAATQAAWRFFGNPDVTLAKLITPLRQVGREACAKSKSDYALVAMDWSKLDYASHKSKTDQTQLTQALDRGYDWATALLVSAEDGAPLAPMGISVLSAAGMHTTEAEGPQPRQGHLEQVLSWMVSSKSWGLNKKCVFVIDREADSLKHMRQWQADGHHFLIRADDRLATHRGEPSKLSQVCERLQAEQAFQPQGIVTIRDQQGEQWVAETEVMLDAPAWGKTPEGKNCRVPGPPLRMRLVIVHVRDAENKLLAEWLLLSNVWDVSAKQIALWYYWRWRIESFHKLLKSAGLEVEEWQQENASAIAKRLLVGCMACVTVWNLQRQTTPEAQQCQQFLVRLSGRQMKRKKPVTTPALLAGLHVLLLILETLEHYTIDQLRTFAQIALGPRCRSG